ncbi:MAG: DUF2142 domain-containing protein [Anaerolineales bacterium]|nr:MAG: DUF2142 domain-containing protein [Anaerolineales bacterium]
MYCSDHKRKTLALLLTLSLIRGVLYSAVTPPWQAPDEPGHFQYVAFLVRYHRLPTRQDIAAEEWLQTQVYVSMQESGFWARRAHTLAPPALGKKYRAAVGHPPLYYLLGALLLVPFSRCDLVIQLHVLRLGSVLLGTLTVLVAYLTAQALFPEDASWQLAIPAFIAFLPMHAFITSSVNNDSLAELLVSLVIYSLLRILKDGLSWQRAMSIVCLLASSLLTKRTTTFAIPLATFTILLYCLRAKPLKSALKGETSHPSLLWVRQRCVWLLIVSAIGLGLWTLTLNSPFSIRYLHLLLEPQRYAPAALRAYALFFLLTFASFWANFGWLNVPLDLGWYTALAVFSLLALCGLGFFAVRVVRGTETLETWQRRALLMLLLAVVLIFAQTSGLMIVQGIPQQGRYLFPALIPLAVFFTVGLREWVPTRHRSIFPLALVLGMFVLDSVSLCCYIIPHFYG